MIPKFCGILPIILKCISLRLALDEGVVHSWKWNNGGGDPKGAVRPVLQVMDPTHDMDQSNRELRREDSTKIVA